MAKTQKIHRDPGAPKRNVSAYLLYQNAMRNTFRAQHPAFTFGELSKHTSAMYACLPQEEKEGWQARAEADKARYLRELAAYVPPPGYDETGYLILRTNVQSKGKERDPGAPKRNLSAYLLYQNAMRDEFKRDNPGMSFGQLSKYTSHMYKSLTDEEKSAWEYRAEQDKFRYEEEMKTYNPPEGYDALGNLRIEYKIARKNKNRKQHKDPNAPKRARGSYVLFTQDYRPKVLAEYPDIKFIELGTVLGQKWRDLSSEERKKYDELAKDDKMRFAAEMEVYKSQKEQEQNTHFMQQQQEHQHHREEIYNYQPHLHQIGMVPDNINNIDHFDQHHSAHYHQTIPQQELHQQQYNEHMVVRELNAHESHYSSSEFPKTGIDQKMHLSQTIANQHENIIIHQHSNEEITKIDDDHGPNSDDHYNHSLSLTYENIIIPTRHEANHAVVHDAIHDIQEDGHD